MGHFGDILNDSADIACCVVIQASRLVARLEDVSDELGEVMAKTWLGGSTKFAKHWQMVWVRFVGA